MCKHDTVTVDGTQRQAAVLHPRHPNMSTQPGTAQQSIEILRPKIRRRRTTAPVKVHEVQRGAWCLLLLLLPPGGCPSFEAKGWALQEGCSSVGILFSAACNLPRHRCACQKNNACKPLCTRAHSRSSKDVPSNQRAQPKSTHAHSGPLTHPWSFRCNRTGRQDVQGSQQLSTAAHQSTNARQQRVM